MLVTHQLLIIIVCKYSKKISYIAPKRVQLYFLLLTFLVSFTLIPQYYCNIR